jgi:carboxymethylenebutenolidase
MPPLVYDPNSLNEQIVSLPSAPPVRIIDGVVRQPPLTRRETAAPGLLLLLPSKFHYTPSQKDKKPLDPDPVQKWAEEGFTVVGITVDQLDQLKYAMTVGLSALFPPVNRVSKMGKFAFIGEHTQ